MSDDQLSYGMTQGLYYLYSYPMGHHSHSFVSKNYQKQLKNMFLMMLPSTNSYSIHKYVLRANWWCSVILWYHLRCLLHSWPYIVTPLMTIVTHLKATIGEKGWKTSFWWCTSPQPLIWLWLTIVGLGEWRLFWQNDWTPYVLYGHLASWKRIWHQFCSLMNFDTRNLNF